MKTWRGLLAALASLLFGPGCAGFKDNIIEGVPNLTQAYAGNARVWRMGQPPDAVGWAYVISEVQATRVLVIKLNDDVEGDDSFAANYAGWRVVSVPIPPEDDKPWTVLTAPRMSDVVRILQLADEAYRGGMTVVFHCSHGRDRTGLLVALFGMRLFGWSKQEAWKDMITHGFRWELPDLDAFFAAWP